MKKPLTLLAVLGLIAAAGVTGWLAGSRQHASHSTQEAASANAGRKILYYRSGMHPWIKSDKPGNCTICGMPLTPVFEGDRAADDTPGVVSLSSNSIQVLRVRTAEVRVRPLNRTMRVAGIIDDNDATHRRLSAYIEGRIETLNVDSTGAEVIEGQPLATFHSPFLLAMEKEYLGVLRQWNAAPPSAKAELETLKKAAERRLRLMGITQEQIDALVQRNEEDHLHVVLSPMSGTVVSREVYAGQYVKEGDRLFEIADFSTMWFKFDAYERDLPWLKVGQEVDVTTPSVPGRVFKASIRFIDPNLLEASRTAKVRVEIPNPLIEDSMGKRRELRHRLYAEAQVRVALPPVLSVPRSSVLNPGSRALVYVDKGGGYYQQRAITLGRASDDDYEVLAGLQAGDHVVVEGNLLIDSQAQLNAGIEDTALQQHAEAKPAPGNPEPLSPVEETSLKAFLTLLDRMRKALAEDDLPGFTTASASLPPAAQSLAEALAAHASLKTPLDEIRTLSRIAPPASLAESRKAFHALSQRMIPVLHGLIRPGGLQALKVYQCPMTSKAFEGAPKSAQWIQLEGPLENPYMGRAMQDCGTEVTP